jgi:hypothetical protein
VGEGVGVGDGEGDGEGDGGGGGGPGKERMGEGDWETGWDGVEEGDGEAIWDGRPGRCSQTAGPSGGLKALAGACPGAAVPGGWRGWLGVAGWLLAWYGSDAASGTPAGCC